MRKTLAALCLGCMVAGTAPALASVPAPVVNEQGESPFVDLVRKAAPAVVNVEVEGTATARGLAPVDDPMLRLFFGDLYEEFNRQIPMKGAGSGFVISADGQVVTNYHVVDGADKITVTFHDGTSRKAKLVGKDPTFDLALLKVEGKDLPHLELGDSDDLPVGSWVVAIGNPLGLGVEPTVTVGVLSAKDRTIHVKNRTFQGFLQTDAAINPGNSGGPLLDLQGRVVGINSAIAPMAQGIGFAVPASQVKAILGDLSDHGTVERGTLGVYIQDLTGDMADALGLEARQGALVSDLVPGGGAEQAGLRQGDLITALDGQPVKSASDLASRVQAHRQGDTVKVTVLRDKETKDLEVKLSSADKTVTADGKGAVITSLGITVQPADDTTRKAAGLRSDAKALAVTDVKADSPLALQTGDLILGINGQGAPTADKLKKAFDDAKDKSVALLVQRNGRAFFLVMRP